ncbi:MAG: PfkB family carbohydrate kinase [Paracoccaceae bacterium]
MLHKNAPVLCIGSALWDTIASTTVRMKPGYDVPGSIVRRPGGVALNIALALVRTGQAAALLSTIGKDAEGDALIAELIAAGVDCQYVTRTQDPTDNYLAVETVSGAVFAAVADCASLEKAGDNILSPLRDGRLASLEHPWHGAVIIDGNLPVSVLESISTHRDFVNAALSFVPASPGKAGRMRTALKSQGGTLFVNKAEAEILCRMDFIDSIEAAKTLRQLGAHRAVVTDGPNIAALSGQELVEITPPKVDARTTTGAGDVFLAAFVATELAGGHPAEYILQTAVNAAAAHITKETV